MTDSHATTDRAARVRGRAAELAVPLAQMAEELLAASNRLRDGSIQAHMEASAHLGGVHRRLMPLEADIRANCRAWSEP